MVGCKTLPTYGSSAAGITWQLSWISRHGRWLAGVWACAISSELTLAALTDALAKYPAPTILHSDQGTEYLSYKHQLVCDQYEITLSCSTRASPWQNGFMERFFGSFKPELGRLANYQDLGQLYEAIALTVHYYNHDRIHLALKMSPAAYAASLMPATLERDKVATLNPLTQHTRFLVRLLLSLLVAY